MKLVLHWKSIKIKQRFLFFFLRKKIKNPYKITDIAIVSVRAGTIEGVFRLVDKVREAGTAVFTSVFLASDELDGTVFAAVTRLAGTKVVSSFIYAGAVLARLVAHALIDIVLAVLALEALITLASVTPNPIHAHSGFTRIAFALVYIRLAVNSSYSLYTNTFIPEKIHKIAINNPVS